MMTTFAEPRDAGLRTRREETVRLPYSLILSEWIFA